jgi:hypothetical protein
VGGWVDGWLVGWLGSWLVGWRRANLPAFPFTLEFIEMVQNTTEIGLQIQTKDERRRTNFSVQFIRPTSFVIRLVTKLSTYL